MGCDIHMHVEVRIDDDLTWHHWSAPHILRDYRLFAKMANVRNHDGEIKPISEPRGLPPDASAVTAWASELYGSDGHSHSFLTSTEINELRVFCGTHEWEFEKNLMGDPPPSEVRDIRFVFWFDN